MVDKSSEENRLLFDLDETIYMGDIIKVARDQLVSEGQDIPELTGADAADYGFSNFPPVLRERIMQLFKDPMHACINKYALPGIYPFLKVVQECKFWMIGYVTSRPRCLIEATNYVLYRDFPHISWQGRYFSNPTDDFVTTTGTKRKAIREFKPTHYFDDHFDYCVQATQENVPNVYLITNSHTGWNHNHIKNGDILKYNIKPIKSILELDLR